MTLRNYYDANSIIWLHLLMKLNIVDIIVQWNDGVSP